MAVKLHRCPATLAKLSGHPCWKVENALDDAGVDVHLRASQINGCGYLCEIGDGGAERKRSAHFPRGARHLATEVTVVTSPWLFFSTLENALG